MKTFKQYMSEAGVNVTPFDLLNMGKLKQQDKNDVARKTADEVERRMVKKYQLPTKVV
tara:strand:- start:420 stop:593 length:174 start_codon:yes stop_codon:yes gene_type:complete